MPFIQPISITTQQLVQYNDAWKTLVNGPNASTLNSYFLTSAGSNVLINYVFLPASMAQAILAAGPTSIALWFVVAPGTSSFSMGVAGLDVNNQLLAPCYLAGVGGRATVTQAGELAGTHPETIDATLGTTISLLKASNSINGWNSLAADALNTGQFNSGYSERLSGYNYSVGDLQGALSGLISNDTALWFNFGLNLTTPKFDTVLTRNTVPTPSDPGTILLSDSVTYFDVAKPVPPHTFVVAP